MPATDTLGLLWHCIAWGHLAPEHFPFGVCNWTGGQISTPNFDNWVIFDDDGDDDDEDGNDEDDDDGDGDFSDESSSEPRWV